MMGKSVFCERRALSAAAARWQSVRCAGLAVAALATWTSAAQANQIQTLPLGAYSCELPGDAMGSAGHHVPAEDFAIVHSSTYASWGKQGSYLLTANIITMTSGPKSGEKFHRISNNFLRKINPDGTDGELRCIRMFTNNRE